jgi:hypothetical protein
MVAYSFQIRFTEPVLAGTKWLTVPISPRRHAWPGKVNVWRRAKGFEARYLKPENEVRP